MRSRIATLLLTVIGCIILVGFFPATDAFLWQVPAVASVFPAICGLILLTTSIRLGQRSTIVLAALVLGSGAFLADMGGAFSHTGIELSKIHVWALTLAVSGSLILLVREPVSSTRLLVAAFGLVVSATASLWSVEMGKIAFNQAVQTADGAPYCVARHDGYSRQAPVKNLAGLRGSSFYTTASGYKANSSWYFHGVMIVSSETGLRYFNWSPRDRRFDLVERESLLIIPIRGTCEPDLNFLENLPFI